MDGPCALIPAAGRGERARSDKGREQHTHPSDLTEHSVGGLHSSKVLQPIFGRPMLVHTLLPFQASPKISSIVLVVGRAEVGRVEQLAAEEGFTKVAAVVPGGDTRQESVRLGLDAVPSAAPLVAIHDGARPLVTEEIIHRTIDAAAEHGAAVAAVRAVDTVKLADESDFVQCTPPRERAWIIQTPQTFRADLIREAHRRAAEEGFVGTDDASLVERLGHPVKLVEGSRENFKVTYPEDFAAAERVLRERAGLGRFEGGASAFRVGMGYDLHRLVPGRPLFLCGVQVPHDLGLLGHSDADAPLHALMDAMLGAAGLPDIGSLFPDTDPKYAGASSAKLLEQVVRLLAEGGWRIANVDITIVAERPKLAPYVPVMKEKLSRILELPENSIGIKAKTNEGFDSVGRQEAIAAYAVAVVVQSRPE
ncbi:MAG: 2-C-methyl-D-erythritol 4-phosphate cytidylyltransferase [Armatimonadota bacterium]